MNARRILSEKNEKIKYINPEMTVSDALVKMRSDNTEAQIVSYNGYSILGVVTERNIKRVIDQEGSGFLKANVARVMDSIVVNGFESDDVPSMIGKMTRYYIQYLPIITRRGHFRGLISFSDLSCYSNPNIHSKNPVRSQGNTELFFD